MVYYVAHHILKMFLKKIFINTGQMIYLNCSLRPSNIPKPKKKFRNDKEKQANPYKLKSDIIKLALHFLSICRLK